MNIYSKANANGDRDNIGIRWWMLGCDSSNNLTNLVTSGSGIAYVYDSATPQQLTLSMIIQNSINISSYTNLVILTTVHNKTASSHSCQLYYQSPNSYSHIHTSIGIPGPTGPTGPMPSVSVAPSGNYSLLLYDNSGNIHYSTDSNSNNSKTFVIDHPTDSRRYLVHGCLEGPEAGVYYRGTGTILRGTRSTVIELPNYVDKLARNFTIHITCKGRPILLGASDVFENLFEVYTDTFDGAEFYWIVYAQRASIVTEPYKSETVVHGEGPYRWI
jgi:hypothetical protein